MRFGAAFWVQRTGWPELREAVLRAEAAGFDDLWIDDHLLSDEGDWPDPKLEGWTTLAAVAAVTDAGAARPTWSPPTPCATPASRRRWRRPLDHVSGGRAILGIGAGWFEREHEAFGFDFGSGVGERLDRLVEAVPLHPAAARRRDGDARGAVLPVRDAVCAPRPVQPRLPILIGGSGPTQDAPAGRPVRGHVERATARPTSWRRPTRSCARACEAAGRDEREIERTVNLNVVIRADRAEAERAWAGWHDRAPPAGRRGRPRGRVARSRRWRRRWRAIATWASPHPVLIFRTPFDLETIDQLPELRARLEAG